MSQQPDQSQQQADSSAASTPEPASANESESPSNATNNPEVSGAGSVAPESNSAQVDSSAATTPDGTAEASAEASATPAESAASNQAVAEVSASKTGKSRSEADQHHHRSTPSPSPSGRGTSAGRRKRMKLGELDLEKAKIGFLGAGKMAESTINGLIHYARVKPGSIHVAAPSSRGLEKFKAMGCRVTKRNYDIFGRYDCDIVFLCFHGYVIKHCYKLGGTRPHPLTTNYIPHQRHPVYILSLVSGVSLSQIKACLLNPDSSNKYVLEIHRIMMNTAVGHGLGICAVDCEPESKKLSAPLRKLLTSIAQLEYVPASQMDAACAIGGSGLAFSYFFIQALADGAFRMGLSRQQAIRFASKTAQCAAQTMLESGKHPAELRDNVSSPSGAAIYGIHVLEKNDIAGGVTAAVEAAHKRANDLATQEVQN